MKMKRIGISVLLTALVLVTGLAPACVFAGNINGNEANIIAQASGTFQYEGRSYVATQAALGQLTSYLSQDGIDLTADQAARALSLMYSNIEGGVLDGILVPVDGGDSGEASSDASDGETASKENKNSQKETVIKQKAGKAAVEIDKAESHFIVEASGKGDVFSGQLPVKNTGFRLGSFFVLLAVVVCILPAAVIASYRSGLFARRENGY